MRRSLIPIFSILNLILLIIFKTILNITVLSITVSSILDILNYIIFRKENIKVQKKFTKRIDGLLASVYRGLIEVGTLPYKAWISLKAIVKTIYRMKVTKEHLLEWTTAEEAEKNNKNDLKTMYKNMTPNVIFGILGFILLFVLVGNGFAQGNSHFGEFYQYNVRASIARPMTDISLIFIAIFSLIFGKEHFQVEISSNKNGYKLFFT